MSLTDQLAYYEMEADAIKKVRREFCSHCCNGLGNAFFCMSKCRVLLLCVGEVQNSTSVKLRLPSESLQVD